MFGGSLEGVLETCKMVGFNPKKDIKSRSLASEVQFAWSSCSAISTAEEKQKAEKRVLGLTETMHASEYNTLRLMYEKAHGDKDFEDRKLPGTTLLEMFEKHLREGEYEAPTMTEIPSLKEVKEAEKTRGERNGVLAGIGMTTNGAMIKQSVRVKVPPPNDCEGFRYRIKLLETSYEFIKLKNPRGAIATSTEEL